MASIVLFDGVCNFCSDAVNFIIRRDLDGRFRFAALQSDVGQKFRADYGISDDIDSVVLIEDGQVYLRSTAALRIAKSLGFPTSMAYPLIALPASIRDYLYKLFADNRYRIFGKKDTCMIPTSEIRSRFLT